MKVDRLNPDQWHYLSERAHLLAFDKHKPVQWERIDFALLCIDDNGTVMGYGTFKEIDSKSVYWQYGGTFHGTRHTATSFKAFQEGLRWLSTRYERVSMYVENTNLPALKFAMKMGYRIVGVKLVNEMLLLEHLLEFPRETRDTEKRS